MKYAAIIAVSSLLLLNGCTGIRLGSGRPAGLPTDLTDEEQQFVQALAHYGQALLFQGEQGRFSNEALEEFKAAADADPSTHRLSSRVALGHLVRNRTNEAVNVLEESCARSPDSVQARVDLASVCQMVGQTDRAIKHYGKAIELNPKRADLYVELAEILFQEKKDDLALRAVRAGLRNGSSRDPVLVFVYRQALQLLGAGDTARSLPCFRIVRDLMDTEKHAPLSARFFFIYGSACEQAGEIAESERVFQRCIELYPDAHSVLNYLAYMWAEQGVKLEQALEYVLRAIEKDKANAAYIDTLGWIYYKQKQYDLALKYLKQAFDLVSDDPTIADHLGDAFLARNDRKQATAHWKLSFMLNPKNEALVKKLQQQGIDTSALLPKEQAKPTN